MKKKVLEDWRVTTQSGYGWPHPKRISIYLFDAQIKMLEEIAKDKGIRKRHVFFEAIQFYIGTYLRQKKEREERP